MDHPLFDETFLTVLILAMKVKGRLLEKEEMREYLTKSLSNFQEVLNYLDEVYNSGMFNCLKERLEADKAAR